jgi:hypothetical protein
VVGALVGTGVPARRNPLADAANKKTEVNSSGEAVNRRSVHPRTGNHCGALQFMSTARPASRKKRTTSGGGATTRGKSIDPDMTHPVFDKLFVIYNTTNNLSN